MGYVSDWDDWARHAEEARMAFPDCTEQMDCPAAEGQHFLGCRSYPPRKAMLEERGPGVISGYASLRHYAEHIQPILDALPPDRGGEMWSPASSKPWGLTMSAQAPRDGLWIVASYADARKLADRPLVYVEHGAGQTYPGDFRSAGHGAFSGGEGMDHVRLFICPSETVADRWRARYPQATAVAVGCPRLDSWHARMGGRSVLGEGRAAPERLLDLDRGEGAERVRPGPDRREAPTRAPGGVLDGDGRVADRHGPRLPQRGPDVLGRRGLPAPGVREPLASSEHDPEGEPGSVAADGTGTDVRSGALVDAGEHLRPSGQRSAPVPNLPERPKIGRPYPVVAVTFHHEHAQIPEQTSARTHYRDALPALRDAVADMGGQLLGHGHPRAWPTPMRDLWRRINVPCTDDLGEVFDRADLLVADNTSALPEFASLGRPVVWLNAPWYRRDVDHGGRFWAWPRGQVQVDTPPQLIDAVRRALTDPPEVRAARERMVRSIYAFTDGHAADRAAEAILGVL